MDENKKLKEETLDKISGGEGEQNAGSKECTCDGVNPGETCPNCGKVKPYETLSGGGTHIYRER